MRRRRRGGCVRQLLIIAIALALGYVLINALNILLFAPWAYGIFGRPTLTGDWNGTLRTLGGAQYAVYLQLSRSTQALSSPRAPDLDGHLSWCARSAPGATETLHGTANRSASDVRLYAAMPSHPRPGLVPSNLRGAWHGSTLALHVLFTQYTGHGYVYSTAIRDEMQPVELTLHKSGYGTYRNACARISGP